jgi:Domain of unknown function (DUF3846)
LPEFDKHPEDQMIRLLIIRPDGTSAVEYQPQSWVDVIAQREFGGVVMYERQRLTPWLVMYMDEDGKHKNLQFNPRATYLFNRYTQIYDDFIVGTVILAGPVDAYGYDTGVDLDRLEQEGIFTV